MNAGRAIKRGAVAIAAAGLLSLGGTVAAGATSVGPNMPAPGSGKVTVCFGTSAPTGCPMLPAPLPKA